MRTFITFNTFLVMNAWLPPNGRPEAITLPLYRLSN
jgi:hypothetical protein